jgi:hypothetical protein
VAPARGLPPLRCQGNDSNRKAVDGAALSLRDELQQIRSPEQAIETPEYLDFRADRIYCVFHAAVGNRRGGVLIAPPFGRERMDSYTAIVTWARRLAATGFDVVRFDYRATGESTGRFDAIDLHAWLEDVQFVAGVFAQRLHGAPLMLQGIRFGAVLAAARFAAGQGDAMLLWEPPGHGKDLLFEVLRGKLLEDMALGVTGARKTRDTYISDLLAGQIVEVDGHPWTRGLWESAQQFALTLPGPAEQRPWQSIQLVKNPKLRAVAAAAPWKVPIPSPPFWKDHPDLVPDLADLFEVASRWLVEAAGKAGR